MYHSNSSSRKNHAFFLIAVILTACLAAAPVFATDPEEVDPDPEGLTADPELTTRIITLSDLSDLETARLEPGRYIVRIADSKGARTVYEIVINP